MFRDVKSLKHVPNVPPCNDEFSPTKSHGTRKHPVQNDNCQKQSCSRKTHDAHLKLARGERLSDYVIEGIGVG
jgi:hypothetical protein